MNRAHFQTLAEQRSLDAAALLQAGNWSGAYYLAGYAVECALKACIAKLTKQYDFPDKELAQKCYTHKIEVLLSLAGLESQRDAAAAANSVLGDHWLVVKDWNELARYEHWTELQARKLVNAVNDSTNGVLSWIAAHW